MHLYLWGAGKMGTELFDVLISNSVKESIFFVDNDSKKWGRCENVEILSPDVLLSEKPDDYFIIIPNYPYVILRTIFQQIKLMKIERRNYFVSSADSIAYLLKLHGNINRIYEIALNKIIFLDSMEFEVAHHCNMNCKGCNHFSPITRKKLGDINKYRTDLIELRKKVEYLREFRLLGGEPFLHPQLPLFIEATRDIFAETKLHILTNGLLLLNIDENVFRAIRENNAIVGITIYPPVKPHFDKIVNRLERLGVQYDIFDDVTEFAGQLNVNGDSDPDIAEGSCVSATCHMLDEGKLAKCTVAHKVKVFNEKYNTNYPVTEIDLYHSTPDDIWNYFTDTIEMCRFCGRYNYYKWDLYSNDSEVKAWYCREKY